LCCAVLCCAVLCCAVEFLLPYFYSFRQISHDNAFGPSNMQTTADKPVTQQRCNTLHGTDYIPSCIAVLLSISFIRWSEFNTFWLVEWLNPVLLQVFDVLRHARVIYIIWFTSTKKNWKIYQNRHPLQILLPIKVHKRIRNNVTP
jgi:hypothetical protein